MPWEGSPIFPVKKTVHEDAHAGDGEAKYACGLCSEKCIRMEERQNLCYHNFVTKNCAQFMRRQASHCPWPMDDLQHDAKA